MLGQFGLVVECIDVRRSAVAEDVNDMFRLAFKVRLFGR